VRLNEQSPPPLRHALGETRLIKDWIAARLTEDALAQSAPGDGRSILVLPGMFTSDRRTRVMRRVLAKAGYDVHGWEMGRHMPGGEEILERVDGRVSHICRDHGQPVTLVGWSLGGLVAREYAKRHPEKVAGVVTLGSPFSGNPRSNRAWRLWEFAAKQKIEDSPFGHGLGDKPPVDTTAIWSARDGIIPPPAARGLEHERDREIEVNSCHFAMACAPSPLVALRRTLRENPPA